MSQGHAAPAGNHRAFLWFWLGHLLSMLTMSITDFALGVWAYEHSGSVTRFSAVLLSAILPGMAIAPWAGSVVDRCDRRRVIVAADVVYLGGLAVLVVLLALGQLQFWHILASNTLGSLCHSFRAPAYLAASSNLLPKEQLGRFSGLRQMAVSLAEIGAPMLAGILLAKIGLPAIILLNAPTYALAVATLLQINLPEAAALPPDAGPRFTVKSALEDCRAAVTFLMKQPLLKLLIAYAAVVDFVLYMATTLLVPLVLAAHSEVELGSVASAEGIGALVASVLMTTFKLPKRLVLTVLLCDVGLGLAVLATGAVTWTPWLCLMAFFSMLFGPLSKGLSEVLWQRKLPNDLQGRVFALKGMISQGIIPAATLLGGGLADHIFEPWLRPGGWLAGSVGVWIGVGKGRGIGCMFVLAGLGATAIASVALLRPALRNLDLEVPDAS